MLRGKHRVLVQLRRSTLNSYHINKHKKSPPSEEAKKSSTVTDGTEQPKPRVNFNQNPSITYLSKQLSAIEENMRFKGWSFFWCIPICVLLVFSGSIKDFFTEHGAHVASQSLSSENVQSSAGELSKNVVQQVLEDPKTSDLAVTFLTQLVKRDDTKQLVSGLVVSVLQDQYVKEQVSNLAREQVAWYLLNEPRTLEQLSSLVQRTLALPETHESVKCISNSVISDPHTLDLVTNLLSEVILRQYVKDSAVQLGIYTSNQVLSDEHVKNMATGFARAVMMDPHTQNDAGQLLWEAFKVSVTPSWFSGSSTAAVAEPTVVEQPKQNRTSIDASS
ncbi:hypothetical protein AKO1_014757 [Acrasis kona]|uniref:Uncharacterized protein n=1 Tax=Acrasis kona TaxID=1008807 RepID=A0AAW2Z454_9EUKA